MLFMKIVLINVLIIVTFAQVTKVISRNVLLTRKKRYLAFPMKSNLVITISLSKPLMEVQPRGFNLVLECDVPFPLPSDTRLYKKFKRNHHLEKREILLGFETAFNLNGLNGNACVKRMICEAQQYVEAEGKSLARDFLSAIFITPEMDLTANYKDSCHHTTFAQCSIPFLKYILGSVIPK